MQTSKQKPSWSKHRGRPPLQPPPPPPPRPQLEGPFQDLAPGADKAQERAVTAKPLEEGGQAQTEATNLERAPPWSWQELEAGEVRESFYPVGQRLSPSLRPRAQTRHSLMVSLEHNYSKPPRCLQPLPAVEPAQGPPHQPTLTRPHQL